MTSPIGEPSEQQIVEVREAVERAKETLKAIDKLSRIDYNPDEIARMRTEANKIIVDGEKFLSVYGNK